MSVIDKNRQIVIGGRYERANYDPIKIDFKNFQHKQRVLKISVLGISGNSKKISVEVVFEAKLQTVTYNVLGKYAFRAYFLAIFKTFQQQSQNAFENCFMMIFQESFEKCKLTLVTGICNFEMEVSLFSSTHFSLYKFFSYRHMKIKKL